MLRTDACLCREDATERLLDAAVIAEDEWPGPLTRLKKWLTWRLIYAGNGTTMQPVSVLRALLLMLLHTCMGQVLALGGPGFWGACIGSQKLPV